MRTFSFADAQPFWTTMATNTPLIHCMTNPVAINFSANVLLAAGASPAMITAKQEVAVFTPAAANLLINVGTVHDAVLPSMRLAAELAQKHGKPWVLDPVAVGQLLSYRSDFVQEILQFSPAVIRGNAAEILFLAGEKATLRGADSLSTSLDALDSAKLLATQQDCVVAVTGEHDYITDGKMVYQTSGGDTRQTQVTACGCVLSALTAAFVVSQPVLEATAAACAVMKQAGDYAAQTQQGMGTFAQRLLDGLSYREIN